MPTPRNAVGGARGRGLTLIELVVAMAVVAILATVAVPAFGDRAARHRLAATAEMLAMDMAEARYQAAHSGQALHLTFAPGDDWCYAVARAPGCACATAQACQIKVVQGRDHPGVALVSARDASFDAASVAVEPGTAELRGASGEDVLRVDMSPLGRARICSKTGLKGYATC